MRNRTLITVPVDQIEPDPDNPRQKFVEDDLVSLARTLSSSGQEHPITAYRRGDKLRIIDGERRWRAAPLAGLATLDVIVEDPPVDSTNAQVRRLCANLQHADLDPVERARGFQMLMTTASMTATQVAAAVGFSEATVSRSLKLLELEPSLLAQVASGALAPDTAYRIAREQNPQCRLALAQQAERGLSRDALARKLKSSRRADERRASGATRCKAVLGKCSVTFDGPGLSLDTMIECVEQLLSRARKAKLQGLTLQTFASLLRDLANEGKGGRP